MTNISKKHGFTLAETLITLTIIGVVAAMTIPTLMSKYQKHTYVVGLKKAYSQIQNAINLIPFYQNCPSGDYECAGMFQIGPARSAIIDGEKITCPSRIFLTLLSKQFKSGQKIIVHDNDNCDSKTCKMVMGGETGTTLILDTMAISTWDHNDNSIYVDINGYTGPNKFGRDRFLFNIARKDQNGIANGLLIPAGSKLSTQYNPTDNSFCISCNYWNDNPENPRCNSNQLSDTCTGRVLEEDAMNY